MSERTSSSPAEGAAESPQAILLSVIVPVYNQEAAIVENVATIQESIAAGLDEPFELIVVSDGSIDGTAERVLEAAGGGVRVIHYDRNLGKGYAIKLGALEARGRYIAYIDADLDLDPAWLPLFVDTAERENLDFAIGSKRHPDSDVHYPGSRRVASWLYQQLGAHPLQARRPRHAGGAQGVPPRGGRAGAAAAARQAVRVRSRAARRLARPRLRADPRAADPPRLPLHGLRRRLARRRARTCRHGRDLLPAEHPPLLPAQAATGGRIRLDTSPGLRATRLGRDAGRSRALRSRLSEARGDRGGPVDAWGGKRRGPRRLGHGGRLPRPRRASGRKLARSNGQLSRPTRSGRRRHRARRATGRLDAGTCGRGSRRVETRRRVALLPLHTGQPALRERLSRRIDRCAEGRLPGCPAKGLSTSLRAGSSPGEEACSTRRRRSSSRSRRRSSARI